MNKKQWCFLLLTIFIAGTIFYFSDQPAPESSDTSGMIVDFILEHFYPDYDHLSDIQRAEVQAVTQNIVRKVAHYLIYTALGFSLCLLFKSLKRNISIWFAQIAGTLYAASDEIHQIFVEGRAGMWQDVLLDSIGVLTGVLLVCQITKKKVYDE